MTQERSPAWPIAPRMRLAPCAGVTTTTRRLIAAAAAAMCLLERPLQVFACSGPDGHREIAENTRNGYVALLLAVLCFTASIIVRKLKGLSLMPFCLLGLMFAAYPFIPKSVAGDCGVRYAAGTMVLAIVSAVALALQIQKKSRV